MLTFYQDYSTGLSSGVRIAGTERYESYNFNNPYSLTTNTVVMVWYRRDDLTTANQVLIGSQYQLLQTGGTYVTTSGWTVRAQPWGIDFVSVTEGGGFGNSGVGIGWQQPVDLEWHQALFVLEAWSGAFPGTFKIRLYHDGIDCGLYQTGGPGTYGHANSVWEYLELGGVYGRTNSPVMSTSVFKGDLAQAWVGTNNNFDIRDYYQSGPVNLGESGTTGGIKTLNTPAIYDAMDYPFESTSRMWNMSTRATRNTTVADRADGLNYQQKYDNQMHMSIDLTLSGANYNASTGYNAWYPRSSFNTSEYLEYPMLGVSGFENEAVTTTPNWWYRGILRLAEGTYRFRITGTYGYTGSSSATIRITNYPNVGPQNFQTLGSGTDLFTQSLASPSVGGTWNTEFTTTFNLPAYIRFQLDSTTGSSASTSGDMQLLIRRLSP